MLFLLLALVVPGFVLGWACKGRLRGLSQLGLRSIWLVLLGLVVQVVAMGYAGRSWPWVAQYRPAIIVGTYLLVLVGLWRNWRVPGMAVVGLGFALNFAVILANGGQMPVTRQTITASGQGWALAGMHDGQPVWQSKDVLLRQDETRLWPLSDVIVTPPPHPRAASVGDFVAYAGIGLVIFLAMFRARPGASRQRVEALAA